MADRGVLRVVCRDCGGPGAPKSFCPVCHRADNRNPPPGESMAELLALQGHDASPR